MARNSVVEGVFAINKPIGLSSAQVIRDCQQHFNPSALFAPLVEQEVKKRINEPKGQFKRRSLAKKAARVKMGHGGTLDPLATGVLILGVGSGTKSLQSFLDCTKTYETVVLFGADTDSYDRTGRILTRKQYDHITREMVEKELDSFRGKFEQIPPLYSALKMEGKPLYEYAREGKPIPREIVGREVEVKELELLEWYEPGTHNHRWPTEEAETAEKNLAEQVWRVEKQQKSGARKMTPEEAKEEARAASAHESLKRKFDERQDELVRDIPAKRRKSTKQVALMSGALGQLPASPATEGKGRIDVTPPSADSPPPWTDKGPPAARIRMTVTSGFYVRSFCHDLGVKVGSAAMMAELSRSRQGDFALGENCLEFSDLEQGEKVWAPKVDAMLAAWREKHPSGGPRQEAARSDRNQNFGKRQTNGDGAQPPRKQKRERASDGDGAAEKRRRRNSSSGDEATKNEKPARSSPPPSAPSGGGEQPSKADTPRKSTDNESEWEGIQD
ncbi:hypothetical protein ACRALDRAFT_1073597 [Sodiomyces alcalophilus JCM 7366]|uniref:uncharacterized protein n=1 Tax=Sodiomyces alcalophilus JCM 7366 TaxID=591952 RepID=UPI0039B5F040